jgi:hypothetical protein
VSFTFSLLPVAVRCLGLFIAYFILECMSATRRFLWAVIPGKVLDSPDTSGRRRVAALTRFPGRHTGMQIG